MRGFRMSGSSKALHPVIGSQEQNGTPRCTHLACLKQTCAKFAHVLIKVLLRIFVFFKK